MMMLNAECVVETNRKQNIDYTIKDEGKSFDPEKSVANFFAENGRVKRDKSPGTCQNNNTDMLNEIADHLRNNMDNNHTMQCDANGKRQKTVCYDFKKGICRRRFCRVSSNRNIWFHQHMVPNIYICYAPQYPHVMNADQVIFCHDFQNNGCFRANCRSGD